MKAVLTSMLLFIIVLLHSQTITVPNGTTNLQDLITKVKELEIRLERLENGVTSPPPAIIGAFDKLTIKGINSPPSLKILDPFNKGAEFSSIVGDLSLKLFTNPNTGDSGSFRIQDSNEQDVFSFKQNGTIKFDKIPLTYISYINREKTYYFPILDEVGNLVFIPIIGQNILNTIR